MRAIFTSWVATLTSVVGFAWTVWPKALEPWQLVVVTLTCILFSASMLFDLKEHLRRRPKRFRKQEAIVAYMKKWLSVESRAVVFSRDLSWVDADVKQLLLRKAARDELTICVPTPNALALELQGAGATIVAYTKLKYVPKSRFTIVNDGRSDARVAIGKQVSGVHVVEEFEQGEHPVVDVIQDLVEFARRAAK